MSGHTKTPWAYRPNKHDDWGWIRDADGNLAATARDGSVYSEQFDEYRRAGTDPYEAQAILIVKAVNSHVEAIAFLELASKSLWRLGDKAVAHEIDKFLASINRPVAQTRGQS